MTNAEDSDGERGSSAGAPNAFELLGEIPRRAAEQAGEIIDRIVHAFEPEGTSERLDTGDATSAEASFTQLRSAFGRAIDLYAELFQRTLDSFMETVDIAVRRRGVSLVAHDAGALHLERQDGETNATGSLYIHNYSGTAAVRPHVRITDLTATDGSVVPASAVHIRFAAGDAVIEDRSTLRVDVSVDVSSAAAGVYFGHALSGEDAVPVRLTVSVP